MLSRPFDVEELNLFEFETTAFEDEEYVERVKVVQENPEQFPDLRVEEDLLFKRVQFEREDDQGIPLEAVDTRSSKRTKARTGCTEALRRRWPDLNSFITGQG
ncbi:hypothetical protein ACLKA6_017617 [Drosophila palustris]